MSSDTEFNGPPKLTMPDLIVGVGSPHGDDQVGWRLVDLLEEAASVEARFWKVRDPVDLLAHLEGVERLVICDASRSGRPLGTLTRWNGLEFTNSDRRWTSTHRVSLADTLQLARTLGVLPPRVILYGVEVGNCDPHTRLCAEVDHVLPELARRIVAEQAFGEPGGQSRNREKRLAAERSSRHA